MKRVITSCTSTKTLTHPDAVTVEDVLRGHTREKMARLEKVSAGALYAGRGHKRVCRAIAESRERSPVEHWIHSAGFGFIRDEELLPAYDVSFAGVQKAVARQLAASTGAATGLRKLLAQPSDLTLIVLGAEYLRAARVDAPARFAGRTVAFCSPKTARLWNKSKSLWLLIIPHTREVMRPFKEGATGLKNAVLADFLLSPEGVDAFAEQAGLRLVRSDRA